MVFVKVLSKVLRRVLKVVASSGVNQAEGIANCSDAHPHYKGHQPACNRTLKRVPGKVSTIAACVNAFGQGDILSRPV